MIGVLALATPASAETVVAERTIRAQSIIMPLDVSLSVAEVPGTIAALDAVIGMEARVSIYAGRPIRNGDVGPPAIVERNQTIALIFQSGALNIRTEGRALGRGGVGDTIRVMNIGSRSTINGTIAADGSVHVLSGT